MKRKKYFLHKKKINTKKINSKNRHSAKLSKPDRKQRKYPSENLLEKIEEELEELETTPNKIMRKQKP